ncbi:site-specific integrase [soil metagenome]
MDKEINNIPDTTEILELRNSELKISTHENYIFAATSQNTRNAYQADIRHFIAWGGFLPTSSDVVMCYLHEHAKTLNTRTLTRRLTALRNWHQYQGFNDPTAHSAIRKTLVGIKNIHGKPKNKAVALTLETLTIMVMHLKKSNRLIDYRNCALLQLGFFGAFRRSELIEITWEAIRFVKEGIEILIGRSKTDQGGDGQVCAIPYGDGVLCPVTALINWREQSQNGSGYVFRQVKKTMITPVGIKPRQVNELLKSIAKACDLPDAGNYSGHSLRRGFATEASKNNVPFASIKRQGRWRSDGSVLGYIDEGKRFDQNAAGMMLNLKRSTNEQIDQDRQEKQNKETTNSA